MPHITFLLIKMLINLSQNSIGEGHSSGLWRKMIYTHCSTTKSAASSATGRKRYNIYYYQPLANLSRGKHTPPVGVITRIGLSDSRCWLPSRISAYGSTPLAQPHHQLSVHKRPNIYRDQPLRISGIWGQRIYMHSSARKSAASSATGN